MTQGTLNIYIYDMQHLKDNGSTETTFFVTHRLSGQNLSWKICKIIHVCHEDVSPSHIFFYWCSTLQWNLQQAFHNSFVCTERVTFFSNQLLCQAISLTSGLSVSVLLPKINSRRTSKSVFQVVSVWWGTFEYVMGFHITKL